MSPWLGCIGGRRGSYGIEEITPLQQILFPLALYIILSVVTQNTYIPAASSCRAPSVPRFKFHFCVFLNRSVQVCLGMDENKKKGEANKQR